MADYHDPTWLVERAWSVYRLTALQKLVEATIADMERLAPRLGAVGLGGPSSAGVDARAEALKACIEELRHASGMAEAGASRATHCELVRHYIAERPAEWGEAFGVALDEYRRAASSALQASLTAPC